MSEVTAEIVDTSMKHANLAAALAAFQARVQVIGKDQKANVPTKAGGNYSYTYAGLDAIVKVTLPAMAREGLSWSAQPTVQDGTMVLAYQLLHESGEKIEGYYPLPAANTPPQSLGSAITYARRYALCALLGIAPADEDDDGQQAQQWASQPRQSTPPFVPITLEGLDAVKQWIDYLGWDAEKVKKATAYASHNRVFEVEQMSDAEGVTFCQFAETKDPQGGTQEALPVKGTR